LLTDWQRSSDVKEVNLEKADAADEVDVMSFKETGTAEASFPPDAVIVTQFSDNVQGIAVLLDYGLSYS